MTTDEIDKAVHKIIIDKGAYPSPLTYGEDICSFFGSLRSPAAACELASGDMDHTCPVNTKD